MRTHFREHSSLRSPSCSGVCVYYCNTFREPTFIEGTNFYQEDRLLSREQTFFKGTDFANPETLGQTVGTIFFYLCHIIIHSVTSSCTDSVTSSHTDLLLPKDGSDERVHR
jgi:hypothetical protein